MRAIRGESRRRVAEWAPSATAAILILFLWAQVRSGDVPAIDRWARSQVGDTDDSTVLAALEVVKNLGSWVWVAPLVVGVASVVAVIRETARPVVVAAVSVVGAAVVTWLLKAAVARPGPHGVGPPAVDGSWPSGHAVTVVVAALLLVGAMGGSGKLSRAVIGLAVLVPVLVGVALVYGGHHWVTDVAVAAPLSFLVVRAASAVAGTITAAPPVSRGPTHADTRDTVYVP